MDGAPVPLRGLYGTARNAGSVHGRCANADVVMCGRLAVVYCQRSCERGHGIARIQERASGLPAWLRPHCRDSSERHSKPRPRVSSDCSTHAVITRSDWASSRAASGGVV
jgi:hypothetical protein